MLWRLLLLSTLMPFTSGCHALGGVRLTEVSTVAAKPSNVASFVSVTQKGQPVSDLGVAAFRVSEDDQALDSETIDLRLLDPASVAAVHTVLLVDLGHATSEERHRQLSRAAAAFVRRVRQRQGVTVLSFDGSPNTKLVGDFTVEPNGTGPEQLENLLAMVPADPSRNLSGAVIAALDTLDSRLERSSRAVRLGTLVVFSRGPDMAGRVTANDFDERVTKTKHQLIYVDVSGDQTSDRTSALSSAGRVEAESADTLPIAFEEAAMAANKSASQFYLLSYCSPARAGERRLRIEVQVNDAEGKAASDAFETRFDASGFFAPCNSSTPPRFTPPQRAPSERATTAVKPAPAAPDSVAPGSTTTEPAPAGTSGGDDASTDKETEVPPPKGRGYAQ